MPVAPPARATGRAVTTPDVKLGDDDSSDDDSSEVAIGLALRRTRYSGCLKIHHLSIVVGTPNLRGEARNAPSGTRASVSTPTLRKWPIDPLHVRENHQVLRVQVVQPREVAALGRSEMIAQSAATAPDQPVEGQAVEDPRAEDLRVLSPRVAASSDRQSPDRHRLDEMRTIGPVEMVNGGDDPSDPKKSRCLNRGVLWRVEAPTSSRAKVQRQRHHHRFPQAHKSPKTSGSEWTASISISLRPEQRPLATKQR